MRLFALVPVMPFYKLTYFPLITYEKLVEREMLFRKKFFIMVKM